MTDQNKIDELRKDLEGNIPEFIKAVDHTKSHGSELIMHQDAFAADLNRTDMFLLGKAIKYAGTQGVTVTICTGTIDESQFNKSDIFPKENERDKAFDEAEKALIDSLEPYEGSEWLNTPTPALIKKIFNNLKNK